MTIYIVTRGDHAMQDYEIIAVRSSQAAADALARQVGGYVRAWEVDGEFPALEPWGWRAWALAMLVGFALVSAVAWLFPRR